MAKSRQARAREFSTDARLEIYTRDRGKCVFCQAQYHMENATWFAQNIMSVMHYIPRSKNGLGIAQNGAVGCQYHHEMMDNGNQGRREEMLEFLKEYLKSHYPDWDEQELIYSKWRF